MEAQHQTSPPDFLVDARWPLPPERDQATLWAIFARLSPRQQWALERLVAQEGRACGVEALSLSALCHRTLLAQVVNPRTQGWRLCDCRNSRCALAHDWFHIPLDVEEAWRAWSAQWSPPEESA